MSGCTKRLLDKWRVVRAAYGAGLENLCTQRSCGTEGSNPSPAAGWILMGEPLFKSVLSWGSKIPQRPAFLAQLVAHLSSKQEVVGSNPTKGSHLRMKWHQEIGNEVRLITRKVEFESPCRTLPDIFGKILSSHDENIAE